MYQIVRNMPDDDGFSIEPLHCKVHYKKLFLQDVLARIDECDTATDVVNSVNILVAIRWVVKAWIAVKGTTICKSFEKLVAILDSTLNLVIWMMKTLS